MTLLWIEEPENPFGDDFIYIAKAQRMQKFLKPFSDEILSEAPYAVISRDENNNPYLKHCILSGDLQIKISRALNQT